MNVLIVVECNRCLNRRVAEISDRERTDSPYYWGTHRQGIDPDVDFCTGEERVVRAEPALQELLDAYEAAKRLGDGSLVASFGASLPGYPRRPPSPTPVNTKRHKVGLPPTDATHVLALPADGLWVPWDGVTPHYAFSFKYDGSFSFPGMIASHCNGCGFRYDCPSRLASAVTLSRWSCSNGMTFERPRR